MKIVVFGASSAIAQATCRDIADAGPEFFLVGRDAAKLGAVKADLAARGMHVGGILAADLSDTTQHPSLFAEIEQRFGVPDVVLLAHGVLPAANTRESALETIAVNGLSPISLIECVKNRMIAAGSSGLILAISSVAGVRGKASNYSYCAAKGLLSRYMEGLRHQLARNGGAVTLVDVRPGFTDSPMTSHLPKTRLWAPPETVGTGIGKVIRGWQRSGKAPGVVYLPRFWRWIMLVIRHLPERIFLKMNM